MAGFGNLDGGDGTLSHFTVSPTVAVPRTVQADLVRALATSSCTATSVVPVSEDDLLAPKNPAMLPEVSTNSWAARRGIGAGGGPASGGGATGLGATAGTASLPSDAGWSLHAVVTEAAISDTTTAPRMQNRWGRVIERVRPRTPPGRHHRTT